MSIIAGVYSRRETVSVPETLCSSIKQLISRNPEDAVQVFGDNRAFFAKVDIGAFGSPGEYVGENGAVTLVAGEPLLSSDPVGSRHADLHQIQQGLAKEDHTVLPKACGAYCGVDYQPESGQLTLLTGRLGIRPLYYSINDDFVIFSSALRILEELSEVPKRMNVRAVTEIAGLGYALADRTPYMDIYVLKAGEILLAKDGDFSCVTYWRWNEIETSTANEDDLLDELYDRFQGAVSRRLRDDTSTIAYLSGGLDSRCVVSALCEKQAHVHTFNFARPNTQDQLLGALFAQLVGVTHTEIPKEAGDHKPDFSAMMANAWASSGHRGSNVPERPALAWGGEGGSVDLGHVPLTHKIVSLMREGKTNAAVDEFIRMEHIHISPKLLRADAFKELEAVIPNGIREELEQVKTADPGRSFYLFMMLNDQRRKLARHFDDMDLHRLELQLPFFDCSFVELIVSIPLDLCIGHRLYVKWLTRFPKAVTAVAWQSYPGHVPCPLPVPEGLSYQWESGYQAAEQHALKQTLENQAKRLVRSKDFAAEIMNKNNIRLAALIHRTGWRDYGYFIETANVYQKYWTKCKGEYSLS